MTQRLRITGISTVFILAAATLTGCAAPALQAVEPSQPAPSAGGKMALGIVAALRSVSISGAQIGAMAGVNAVLGALSQQSMGPPVAGEEIVIRKDDGNTAAIVEPDQTTPSLAAGDRVALIASSPVVIIRRN